MLNAFFLFPRVSPTVSLSHPLQIPKIEDPQKRSALLRKVIEQIWSSQDLNTILHTAVDEIATLLKLDCCNFLWYFEHSQTVQVVCERIANPRYKNGNSGNGSSGGIQRPSQIGTYPLASFGKTASAIANGETAIGYGPVSQSAFQAMTRLVANCPIARLPHPPEPERAPERTKSANEEVRENRVFGAIANLLVPVKGQEGWLGFITCLSDRPRTWSTAEIEFVQLIAQQLEIAIKQAQLYEQVKKQAQRERLVNQITSQTRQSFDLETILRQAIAQLLEALEVDRCLIHLVENQQVPHKDIEKHSEDDCWWDMANDVAFRRAHLFEVCREPFAPSLDDFDTHGPITQWAIEHRQMVIIPDVTEDFRIGSQNEEYRKAEIKSSLVVPVQANGKLHALLYINQCSGIRYWSKHDRELALAVADQLAISIQQACLYAQTRGSMERESLLRLLSEHIRRTLDLQTILDTIVREVRQLLNTDRVVIYQFTEARSGKIVVEESKPGKALLEAVKQDDCFYRECAEYTEPQANVGVRAIEDVWKADLNEEHLACWDRLQVRASLIVPILIGSKLWGLLIVHECEKPRMWRSSEIDLLQQLANQLAIAIHQAELYDRARTAAVTAETKAQELQQALHQLQQAQSQLIQSEKMSSLGQLVAGVAHEINNPVNFIYGNLSHVDGYTRDLLELLALYQKHYPNPVVEIQEHAEDIELDFLSEDMPKVLSSMKMGADRIREIVLSLRNFSRIDHSDMKLVDVHEGIDSTLLILQNRLKAKQGHSAIEIVKDYGPLPNVECYPGQLNQVFMNILSNAIDALDSYNESRSRQEIQKNPSRISIRTELRSHRPALEPYRLPSISGSRFIEGDTSIAIVISDNGPGMTPDVKARLFDPFFTTKPVGKGTGLGLSISYQIVVEKHKGTIQCVSAPGEGTEFWIEIPVRQTQVVSVLERQLVAVNI